MENCLVTKLKGSVSNNLPKIGIIAGKVRKPSSGYLSLRIDNGKTVTITILGDGDLWLNSNKTLKTRIYTGTGSDQLFNLYGDATETQDAEVKDFWNLKAGGPESFGMDIAGFVHSSSTGINITASSANPGGLYFGDIASLGEKVDITSLSVNYNANLKGSLNELADLLYANGRNSGTLTVYSTGTQIKKDGSVMEGRAIVTFTENGWSFTS